MTIDPLLVLQFAAPVAMAAVGETIHQRAGGLNIGIEGCMLAAAFAATRVCDLSGSPWLGLGAGIAAGLVLAAISGIFTIWQAIDPVVVGTAINLLALGLTGTLYRAEYGESGRLLSVAKLPAFAGLDAGLWFLLLSLPVAWFGLMRTQWGLALRAAGEAPKAAEAAGYRVARLRQGALWIGGAFAGLAGAYLALGINGSFSENCTAGRGFVAIAMVTFGRWRPVWVFAAAMLIGFAESLQFSLQSNQVPFQLWVALPYVLALLVLVFAGKGAPAPGALGVPYRREA